jgi:lipase maturation factor 1
MAPTYRASRWLFLRLLGVVYLVAFLSLAFQIIGLVGAHGLFPAGDYLAQARTTYGPGIWRLLPTVLWLNSSDTALRVLALGGAGLAGLLILDVAPIVVLPLLWLAYLSLVVAGQDFLAFQWDGLLLETGLLAWLWAPAGWLPTLRLTEREPSPVVRWLLWLLLLKLMVLSGLTKLLSGDPTWRTLTALDFHFETQPLPPWTAWFAHHLSGGAHRLMTLAMFVAELLVPFTIVVPARFRRARIGGAFLLIGFQLAIAATGNYGFFNLLAIVLCVPLLDDRFLGRVLPSPRDPPPPESSFRRVLVRAVAAVLLVLSSLGALREAAYTVPAGGGRELVPAWAEDLLDAFAPFRSVNGYGLFRVMTTERPEIVVEGSRDGVDWKAYEFRWKPGDPGRRPGFVEPFHPRLDWQMWFAALDPQGYRSLLESLIQRLLEGTPEVLGLLGRNPFQDAPPKYIRLKYFRYFFSSPEERANSGAWWVREPRGNLTQPVSLPER